MRLPRLPGFNPRRPLEVAGGLLAANAGDVVNITLMAVMLDYLLGAPAALALLPSLAALRGAIATSMAARVSTALHMGVVEASTRRILRLEGPRVAALAMLSSIYAGLVVSLVSGYSVWLSVSVAFVSGAAAIVVLAPAAAALAAAGYRRGVDPDSVLAPVLTILGDITTVPTLIAAYLLVEVLGSPPMLAFAFAYVTLSYTIAVARARRRDRRVVAESAATIALVGLLEAATGYMLVDYSGVLVALGVMHAVPSIMEDTGAAASVMASKVSTLLHLEGVSRTLRFVPAKTLETLAGSLPSLAALTMITVYTGPLAGIEVDPASAARVIIIGGLAMIGFYSMLSVAVSVAAYKAGLDPDNVAVPVLTAIVDALTVPLLALLGPHLY